MPRLRHWLLAALLALPGPGGAALTDDLNRNVGDSARPVVVASHCGVGTDWWHPDDWAAFYRAVKPYNVVAYFYGHTGTGLR